MMGLVEGIRRNGLKLIWLIRADTFNFKNNTKDLKLFIRQILLSDFIR